MIRIGHQLSHSLKFFTLVFFLVSCKPRNFNNQQQTAKSNSTVESGAQNDENAVYEWKLTAISASNGEDPLDIKRVEGHFWFELLSMKYGILSSKKTLSLYQLGIDAGTDDRYYGDPDYKYATRSVFLTAKDYEAFKESLKNFKWHTQIIKGQKPNEDAVGYSARMNCSSFGAQVWDKLTGEKLFHPQGIGRYSTPVFFRTKLLELNGGRGAGFVAQKLPPDTVMERAAEVDSMETARKEPVYNNELCHGYNKGQPCRKWLSPDGKGVPFGGTNKKIDMIFDSKSTGLPIDSGHFEINADYSDFKSMRIVLRHAELPPPGSEPSWSEPLVITDFGKLKGAGPARKHFVLRPMAFRQVGTAADLGIWKATIESNNESHTGLVLSASLAFEHEKIQRGTTVLP